MVVAIVTLCAMIGLSNVRLFFPLPRLHFLFSMDVVFFGSTSKNDFQNSYMLTRLAFYLWPLVLIVVAVRAGVMLFRLNQNQVRLSTPLSAGKIIPFFNVQLLF
jgi:hypothetical protein